MSITDIFGEMLSAVRPERDPRFEAPTLVPTEQERYDVVWRSDNIGPSILMSNYDIFNTHTEAAKPAQTVAATPVPEIAKQYVSHELDLDTTKSVELPMDERQTALAKAMEAVNAAHVQPQTPPATSLAQSNPLMELHNDK